MSKRHVQKELTCFDQPVPKRWHSNMEMGFTYMNVDSQKSWLGWVFEVQMGILRRYMYNKPQKDVGQRKSSKNFNALASGQVIAGFESVPDKDHNCCEQNLILHEMPAVKSSIQIVFWWNDHVSNYHVTQSVKNSRASQNSSHTSQSVIGIHCVHWSIILESDQQKTTHCAPILIMHHWCRIKTVLLYRKIIMIGGVFMTKSSYPESIEQPVIVFKTVVYHYQCLQFVTNITWVYIPDSYQRSDRHMGTWDYQLL